MRLLSVYAPEARISYSNGLLWPGAGVGGHYHLERGELDFPAGRESLYTLARGINDFMPEHMVHLTEPALGEAGKSLAGSKIALSGLGVHQRLRRRPEHAGGAVLRCGTRRRRGGGGDCAGGG